MSLKIRCINYDTVFLSTTQDLQIFTEELKVLLATGYSVQLEIFATNMNTMDLQQDSKFSFKRNQSDDHDTTSPLLQSLQRGKRHCEDI